MEAEVIIQPDQTNEARQVEITLNVIANAEIIESDIIGRGYGGTYAFGNY